MRWFHILVTGVAAVGLASGCELVVGELPQALEPLEGAGGSTDGGGSTGGRGTGSVANGYTGGSAGLGGIPGDGGTSGSGGATSGAGGSTGGITGASGSAQGGNDAGGSADGGMGGDTSGGSPGAGGQVSSSGGDPGSGGQPSSGGAANTGGQLSSGGAANTGGQPGTGGATSTGGQAATGGAVSTGGRVGSGGVAATGGIAGTGGGTGSCKKPPCDCDGDGGLSVTCSGGDDCDDNDPLVYKNEPIYYATPSLHRGFDYDCSSTLDIEPAFNVRQDCSVTNLLDCKVGPQGFLKPIPACGGTGDWGTCKKNLGLTCADDKRGTQQVFCK